MNKYLFILFCMSIFNLQAQHPIPLHSYPTSKKGNVVDTYFGQQVEDPYRWLEDDNSPETMNWVLEQNAVTFDYLNRIPDRSVIHNNLMNNWNYAKYSSPFKEGDYYLFYKNNGLQNQSVLYIQKGLQAEPQVFIDPNTLSKDGTVALNNVSLSKKQKYAAYSVSGSGSDWQDIYVMEVESKKILKDKISYSKFSGISWKGDDGFYYSGYDKPKNEDEKYSAKTEFQKIFYHKMGTSQDADQLIYEDREHPLRYKGAFLSEDENWLILSLSDGTDGVELQYLDMKSPSKGTFKMLCPGYDLNQDFIDVINGKFLIFTNWKAPNYQLILIDPKHPEEKNWMPFIKESKNKLNAVSRVGDKLFLNYLENASSKVEVYSLEGNHVSDIQLPGIGTASGFGGTSKDKQTFYTYSSFNAPPTVYQYDLATAKSTLFKQTHLKMDLSKTIVEQMWFTSKDGTEVPMFVYYSKNIDLKKGPHPVLLYGYGGFNIPLTPSFSIPMSYFVEKGGVYVVVNLRGGSEFGEEWHKAGMLENKQNVFDDFIGAAEFLISKGITSSDKLAIHGRSNGGLLVGACLTQRPDLYKVALPGVGVLDMLRYQKFTVGWGWVVEYGSSENENQFNFLKAYSPLHNVRKIDYPATLITTADHDDRVVPAHSFKFAATLQEKNTSSNPMLIRIDTQAGHGAGKSTTKQIDEWSDVMSFVFYHLGMHL
ncbi:MAG: prolyl oligopeptidase family serine peptidase [Chitinophagaceae bacterium]